VDRDDYLVLPCLAMGKHLGLTRRHILCTKSRNLIISLQISNLVVIAPISEERFHRGFHSASDARVGEPFDDLEDGGEILLAEAAADARAIELAS